MLVELIELFGVVSGALGFGGLGLLAGFVCGFDRVD